MPTSILFSKVWSKKKFWIDLWKKKLSLNCCTPCQISGGWNTCVLYHVPTVKIAEILRHKILTSKICEIFWSIFSCMSWACRKLCAALCMLIKVTLWYILIAQSSPFCFSLIFFSVVCSKGATRTKNLYTYTLKYYSCESCLWGLGGLCWIQYCILGAMHLLWSNHK